VVESSEHSNDLEDSIKGRDFFSDYSLPGCDTM
jgi:hypothetical protein